MAFGDLVGTPSEASFASGEATATFTAATLGNLLLFVVGRSAVHSAGGAWGAIADWNMLPNTPINSGNLACGAWWKIAVGGETTVVTTDTNEQGTAQCTVCEFEGPFAVSPLDVTAENEANIATVVQSCSSGTTGATAQNDALAIGYWGGDSTQNFDDRAYTNSFVESIFTNISAARGCAMVASLVLSAIGTVECTLSTTDTGDEMFGAMAVFKKLVAAGSNVNLLSGKLEQKLIGKL